MNRGWSLLSKGMLLLGGLLILSGLGWGIWVRVNAPPPPIITDAGAVVLAVTAPVHPTAVKTQTVPTQTPAVSPSPTPSSSPEPIQSPAAKDPAPDLLPSWDAEEMTVDPTTQASPSSAPASPTPDLLTQGKVTTTPTAPVAVILDEVLEQIAPTPTPLDPPPTQSPPTRIVAPAIDLDAKVVPMGWEIVDRDGTFASDWVVPKKAAGWHVNSKLPGQGGNIVLSGHHNIEGKVFRYVVDLNPGDEITLYEGNQSFSYLVTEKYILKEVGMPRYIRVKNAQWIRPAEDERLTLVTCWPYEWPGNSHRVIVVARPSGSIEAAASEPK